METRDRARVAPLTVAALLTVGAALAPSASTVAPDTIAADRFVDAAGVNIHLHYDNTPYRSQFPLIKRRLIELGVRHVRDGLVDTTWQGYYDRLNELGAAGIKGTFVTSPEQSTALWIDYPTRVSHSFEAYEAPNEYDRSNDPDWAQVLTATLTHLRKLKSDARVTDFPVYGPSLTSENAYETLGDVSAYFDFANLHNYFAGRQPSTQGWGANGFGSIAWNLDLAARHAPGKPVVTTETGYQDSASQVDWVPADVAGRYMPIVLLEQFRAGIVRTFLYELIDFPKSGSYGLLEQDGSPKPAFTAVKGLLSLLADPGPAFTPQRLQYTIGDERGNVRHLAFQKRDGTYFLALWLPRPSYDLSTGTRITVAAQRVEVTLPSAERRLRTHEWQTAGAVSTTPWSTPGETIPVAVADRLVVIELAQSAPAAPGNLRVVSDKP
ncbi:MAG: hypothetical protein GEV06_11675 [Luteitalea sp.]|nr:hypothetical protein [Luteitalea sp.]